MPIDQDLACRFSDAGTLDPAACGIGGETAATLATRGSCRRFLPQPVPLEQVRLLCALALSSPTKSDLQQRDIVIIDQPHQRRAIDALFPDDPWIAAAPRLLVFCGNNLRQRQIHQWRGHPFENDHLDAFFNASVDCAIALSAFVIAAEAAGLGCCPISAIRNHAATVSDLLELPEYVFPVAGLALGQPAAPPTISPRLPLSATVHLDRFSQEEIRERIEDYDRWRDESQPYERQRDTERFGVVEHYGWSEDKARQYARPERADFGAFVCSKGFRLD